MTIDELYQVMLEVLLNSYLEYQKPFSFFEVLGTIWREPDNDRMFLSIYKTRYELKSSTKLIIIHKYVK